MADKGRRRRKRYGVVSLVPLFVVFTLLLFLFWFTGSPIEADNEIYIMLRDEHSKLDELKRTLFIIKKFALEANVQVNETAIRHRLRSLDRNPQGADILGGSQPSPNEDISFFKNKTTLHELLTSYYSSSAGDLNYLNHLAEKKLFDDGYTKHDIHSETFWSSIHPIRRGYGLEGSIFIGVIHDHQKAALLARDANFSSKNSKQTSLHNPYSLCASTIESVYRNARWPIGVFVGAIEIDFSSSDSKSVSANDASAPQFSCIPSAFRSVDTQAHLGFQYTDNIRIRRLPFSNGVGKLGATYLDSPVFLPFRTVSAARAATLQLYRGESYIMFLQSGLQMVPEWDWRAKAMYLQLPEPEKAVLSTRPIHNESLVWAAFVDAATEICEVQRLKIPTTFEGVTGPENMIVNLSQYSFGPPLEGAGTSLLSIMEAFMLDRWSALRFALPFWLHPIMKAPRVDHTEVVHESQHPIAVELRKMFTDTVSNQSIYESTMYRMVRDSLSKNEVLSILHHAPASRRWRQEPANAERPLWIEQCTSWFVDKHQLLLKREYEKCWILENREALLQVIANRIAASTKVPLLSASSSDGATNVGGTSKLSFRINASLVARGGNSMQDGKYMRCDGDLLSDDRSATKLTEGLEYGKTMLYNGFGVPYFVQGLSSTAFSFSRAESFVDIPATLQLRLSADANISIAPPPVYSDPFSGFMTEDEADLHLSTALWANGWNVFAPTEPLVFSMDPVASVPEVDPQRIPKSVLQVRRDTVDRLKKVFSPKKPGVGGRSFCRSNAFCFGSERDIDAFLTKVGVPLQDQMHLWDLEEVLLRRLISS